MPRRATYVIRLWIGEPPVEAARTDGDQTELRGSLQAVDTDRLRHFASGEQLLSLVQTIIDDLTRGDEAST